MCGHADQARNGGPVRRLTGTAHPCRPGTGSNAGAEGRSAGAEHRQAGEPARQRARPRPVAWQPQPPRAGVAGQPGGDMPQAEPQRLGLGDAQVAVKQQGLRPAGERAGKGDQRDPAVVGRPVVAGQVPQPRGLRAAVAVLNGLIASDKFCWIRGGRLRLGWWRRPLRLRQDKGATLPTETPGSGRGGHAAHLADPAGDQRAARCAGAVGSGLPARVALDGTAGRSSGPSSTRGDDRCE